MDKPPYRPAPEGGESEEVHWDTQNNIICIRAEGGRKGGPGQEREKKAMKQKLEKIGKWKQQQQRGEPYKV
jgi:hypothetical protein